MILTALHDESGHLTGFAKVTRDRTDLKMLEDAQDVFYATFDHDFRTPVTALKGFVDGLRTLRRSARAPDRPRRDQRRPAAGDGGEVLTNLVVNALKYSPAGTPVDISFDGTRPDRLRVTVRDHGRGIRAQDVDTIFGRAPSPSRAKKVSAPQSAWC